MGDIADIVGGGTPSTGNQSYWDGDIDWYAPAEIADQIYANSSQKKITGLGYENSSAKMLPPGTVLFTSRAGIGKTAILTRKGCTNQGFQSIVYAVIRSIRKVILAERQYFAPSMVRKSP